MVFNRELKTTFGNVSGLYDQSRPSYPQKIIIDILAFLGLSKGTVLDVGCGSGQASTLFAEKGFSVLGLDVSKDLIALARTKDSTIDFRDVSFEEISLSNASFDLVISAQAWHWINPEIGLNKAHQVLKSNGSLALFSYWQDGGKKCVLFDKLTEVLLPYAGNVEKVNVGFFDRHSKRIFEEIKNCGLFHSFERREYSFEMKFTKENHHALMMTFSWIQSLPLEKRKELSNSLKEMYADLKDPLIIPFKYALILGKN